MASYPPPGTSMPPPFRPPPNGPPAQVPGQPPPHGGMMPLRGSQPGQPQPQSGNVPPYGAMPRPVRPPMQAPSQSMPPPSGGQGLSMPPSGQSHAQGPPGMVPRPIPPPVARPLPPSQDARPPLAASQSFHQPVRPGTRPPMQQQHSFPSHLPPPGHTGAPPPSRPGIPPTGQQGGATQPPTGQASVRPNAPFRPQPPPQPQQQQQPMQQQQQPPPHQQGPPQMHQHGPPQMPPQPMHQQGRPPMHQPQPLQQHPNQQQQPQQGMPPLPHQGQPGLPPQQHGQQGMTQLSQSMSQLHVQPPANGPPQTEAPLQSPTDRNGPRARRVYAPMHGQQESHQGMPLPPLPQSHSSHSLAGPAPYNGGGGFPPPQPGGEEHHNMYPFDGQFSGQNSQSNLYDPSQGGNKPKNKYRLDSNTIPCPVTTHQADQEFYWRQPFMTNERMVPPLATTQYRSVDLGHSLPRYVRLTTYSFPIAQETLKNASIPMGAVIQPMAERHPDEDPVPVVDHGESGPVRCQRCKAYVNPFTVFIHGGRKFACNICMFENEVPNEYFANLDMNGRRTDIDHRPELRCGTVDFIATKEYIARPPKPPAYLFAIDVSRSAVQSGMLAVTCDAVKKAIAALPSFTLPTPSGDGSTTFETRIVSPVGIVTYDRHVHFYNLKEGLSAPQMMVVPDIDDVFVPLCDGCLVDPVQSKEVIETLLNQLPTMFRENLVTESAMGAAAKAASTALRNHGGKVILFQSCLPVVGPGRLAAREDAKLIGTDKEKTLLISQDEFYQKLGIECIDAGCAFDVFFCGSAYMDVATMGTLASITGGDCFYYPMFNPSRDAMRLQMDLEKNIKRPFGYDAVLRLRVSNGLRVANHYGNFYMRNATDVEMGWVDAESTFGVELMHDGKLDEKLDTYLQCAMLYTTAWGERRIRLHNVSMGSTEKLGATYKYAEMDAVVNLTCKTSVAALTQQPLKNITDRLTEMCVMILVTYRQHCVGSTMPGQLVMPESFKLLATYTLCMLKNLAFRAGANASFDKRVHMMRYLNRASVASTMGLLYPRLFQLHPFSEHFSTVDAETGFFNYPPIIRCSYGRLEPNGVYLIENGLKMILWVGHQCPPPILQALFRVNALDQIDVQKGISPLETEPSRQLFALMNKLQDDRPRWLHPFVVRQGLDVMFEQEFKDMLVEDANNERPDAVDYLCQVYKMISNILAQQP